MGQYERNVMKEEKVPAPKKEKNAPKAGGPEIGFPIVGIGVSAGGLAAFEALITRMPIDTGMAFILVQHQLPNRKSILSHLIQQFTEMQVCEAEDQMVVEPNCIYIIPSNRNIAFLNGRLCLSDRTTQILQLPIDFFFNSLADDQRERSICIVLSGTDTDGMLGMKAIKAAGGMVIVQQPSSTDLKSMPNSAIFTELADYVLPLGEMPDQLTTYVQHSLGQHWSNGSSSIDDNSLQRILAILHAQTGHDFSNYKQNTVCRRIMYRLAVNPISRLEDYILYLQQSPLEVEALFREFLIGVTSFFRDPKTFEILKKQVVPNLLIGKTFRDYIRIWVTGCSTGEEAYSIAMLISEYMEETKQHVKVQIFASDIDSHALEKARSGIYPINIASNVSTKRLNCFFTLIHDGNAYQIQKKIRDMVIFAEQSVTEDPPFSRLDLISCRNLLIYFDLELQRKVLQTFHYALNPDGFLFLGSSETIGEFEDRFTVVDSKCKLYQTKQVALPRPILHAKATFMKKNVTSVKTLYAEHKKSTFGIRELVESELLRQFTPASVVINKHGEILYIHGRTGKYLELPSGEARMNILQMARAGLRLELNNAISRVIAQKESYHCQGLRVVGSSQTSIVNLTVSLVSEGPPALLGLIIVIFEDVTPIDDQGLLKEVAVTREHTHTIYQDERYEELERELRKNEDFLQTTIEELGYSIEELQSTNEQFQSINEELETSKEEIQSVNEELMSVNAELIKNIDDLSRANNDINNMLTGTGVSIIFLDLQLCIKRFTSIADKIIMLIQNDLGRPINHIATNLVGYDSLEKDVEAVLDTLVPKAQEVQTKNGLYYLMRIQPYQTLNGVIDGAVITFMDITEQKRLQKSDNRLAVIARDSCDSIMMYNLEGRIMAWNPGAQKMYGWSESEAVKMNIEDMTPESKSNEALNVMNKLSRNEKIEPFQTQRISKSGRIIDVWMIVSVLVNEVDEPYAIATIERYI
jgi:two-component system CheB/CheR fusion protein